ncbi:cyclopropane-fatty-acyl-phospholipid synthase family protein [Pendulispora brunnea]|uniref:Cyclopropane-fatty-acyl-phospholipid synthase family protein n=1 Tax=Pendulispora brunnea TaxID=2905690 RepID=A0ABZ2K040_9BACT
MNASTQVSGQASGASPEAIRYHYDVGNDFYRLWLDANMVYSGAMWGPDDDLEAAQLRKIDYHIWEAGAPGSANVLDIGCGWGALLRRLVGEHGVARAVGLTLSDAQAEWARARSDGRVDVRVESWADHVPAAPYDAIISIGAFEHFARLESSEEEKIDNYRAFFQQCQRWLRPNGRMSLQTFAYGNTRSRREATASPSTQFLANEIFPETDPPRLANIAEATEGSFEVVSLRNDRKDYARTCRVWLDNLRTRRDDLVALVGEEKVARYERYLQYSFYGFETGNLGLFRITLRRIEPKWQPKR